MRNLQHFVDEFAQGVIGQKEALAKGDAKLGNRFADKRVRAWQQLRSNGDEGREALAQLLDDDRIDVRVAAAGFLLRYRTERAKQILKEAQSGYGIASLDAQQCLRRWEEGTWQLDP